MDTTPAVGATVQVRGNMSTGRVEMGTVVGHLKGRPGGLSLAMVHIHEGREYPIHPCYLTLLTEPTPETTPEPPAKAASKPVQGSAEMHTARALTDNALATRLALLRDNRRAFPKAQADAFLEEAARRLRWDRHLASTRDSEG